MAEELVLTDPKVEPEKVTNKYKVTGINMSSESSGPAMPGAEPGNVMIQLKDNLGLSLSHTMVGLEAQNFIKFVNTGNFSTKSLNRRILEKLSNDGILPGTVTGTPEPPAGPTGF
jgi:hypothetical protein